MASFVEDPKTQRGIVKQLSGCFSYSILTCILPGIASCLGHWSMEPPASSEPNSV